MFKKNTENVQKLWKAYNASFFTCVVPDVLYDSSDNVCALARPTSHQPLKKKHKNRTMIINPILLSDALYTYKSFFYPTKK